MKHNFLYSFFIILTLMSCGISQSEYQEIENTNALLQQENIELRQQLGEIDYLKDHSQVFLPNTELTEVNSAINGQTYKIKVLLPRGYDKTSTGYPVLYVTDAETNFGGISYIVQRLIKDKLIPPIIVVGVAYGTDYKTFYKLRSRDLTPVQDKELRMGDNPVDPTGGAPKFCDFLSKELFPFIEENYRVDSDDKTIYGHSYGGLFGTYALLNKPELFNRYLILSPSLWYFDNLMLHQIESATPEFNSTRVYMASGKLEGRIDDLQNEFIKKLQERKFSNIAFKAEIMDNETHRTIFGSGFTNGMRYLFKQ